MKQQLGPGPFRALLCDIDNTLYRDDRYAQWQIDVLVERFGHVRGITASAARELVAGKRREIAARDGRSSSLANTLRELGVSIEESVRWRRELIVPADHLSEDPPLRDVLSAIREGGMVAAALTNNPVAVGRASLEALGVADLFATVIGLDTTWHSKPDWEPFAAALAALKVSPAEAIMVGDRWDVDLAPMVERGGGAILVESREDLLALSGVVAGVTS
jgi:FMN phosphatase YigB (HAD superfamily)